jgi:hypothetical protein
MEVTGLENREYGRRRYDALNTRHHLYPQKLTITSPTSGGRSVGIVCSLTQATEFFVCLFKGGSEMLLQKVGFVPNCTASKARRPIP